MALGDQQRKRNGLLHKLYMRASRRAQEIGIQIRFLCLSYNKRGKSQKINLISSNSRFKFIVMRIRIYLNSRLLKF